MIEAGHGESGLGESGRGEAGLGEAGLGEARDIRRKKSMDPIEECDLAALLREAKTADRKIRIEQAKRSLAALLERIRAQKASVARLECELDKSRGVLLAYEAQLAKIGAGDWTEVCEPEKQSHSG